MPATLGRFQVTETPTSISTSAATTATDGRTFIVEDHDLVLSALSSWFASRGHRVHACPPGELAELRRLERRDLVVLDLCLGDRDGIDVLQHLADTGFHGDVILISAFPEAVIEAARAVGVDCGLRVLGALRKPIAFDRLDEMLAARRHGPAPAPRRDDETMPLAAALAADRVTFHAQPILDARTLAIHSIELLARIVVASGREISVVGALADAEADDLGDLARAALAAAGRVGRHLLRRGIDPLPTAINVPSSFVQRRHFAQIVSGANDFAVPLTFEVSELDAFEDLADTRRVATSGVLRGLRFSLDDFGTVNSNIDRFVQIPFDELKLDRAYVVGSATDPLCEAVCRCAVEIAHLRGATVVAEGIETRDDLVRLRDLGVDRVQGYYFARPLPVDVLADWILTHRARTASAASAADARLV
ncbi:MAG: EAL domain-containing protein [Phyllobacteriaceae bacterium]|nr:EAL domain-containing protein [Phyllobacteriaceae bacterium]